MTGEIFYGQQSGPEGDVRVIKFVGEIRYTVCCSLDNLIEHQLAADNLDTVYIDLREVTSIDSTSLGLLAKIANTLRGRGRAKAVLLSAADDIDELLESMGFDEIFTIRHADENAVDCPPARQRLDIHPPPAKDQMSEKVFEAHNVLSNLNDKNRALFEDVLGVLKPKPHC